MKSLALALFLLSSTAVAKTPWEAYLDHPTSANAERVQAIAYSTPIEGSYDADDLAILRLQVVAADPAAFGLAYRLDETSDGALAEELSAILADAIRPNPAFFLAQVKALDQPCAKFNVDVAGLEYVDRPDAQQYELEMRRQALASVASPSLAGVRDECLARLGAVH